MIVAFGFTGVLTALTVMSDIEVLDITTWSWTSVYTPSAGYNTGGGAGGGYGLDNGIGGSNNRSAGNNNVPSSPSISIVAGAVTGGLVVFVLILVAFYFLNYHHKRRNNKNSGEFSEHSTFSNLSLAAGNTGHHHQAISSRNQHEMIEIRFKDPPSATEPFEYYNNSHSRRPSAQIPHPLQINTTIPPTRSDTINTSTTASSGILLPSPWSRIRSSESISESGGGGGGGDSSSKRIVIKQPRFPSDWMVRRATSTPTQHPMQNLSISKPDDRCYPDSSQPPTNLRRAATVCELNKSSISLLTDNSSTATITNKNIRNNNTIHHTSTTIIPKATIEAAILNNHCSHNQSEKEEEGEDDNKFDRQEFILMSNEVAKGEH